MNMHERPPIGAAPYKIVAEQRILTLGQAIGRQEGFMNYDLIELWTKEILFQLGLIKSLDKIKYIDSISSEPLEYVLKKEEIEDMLSALNDVKEDEK